MSESSECMALTLSINQNIVIKVKNDVTANLTPQHEFKKII